MDKETDATKIFSKEILADFSKEDQEKLLKYYNDAIEEDGKKLEELKEAFLKDKNSLSGILYQIYKEYGAAAKGAMSTVLSDPKVLAIKKVRDERMAASVKSLFNNYVKFGGRLPGYKNVWGSVPSSDQK